MIDITHFIILIVTIISPLIDATFHQSSAIPTRKRETFFYFFAKRDPCASICQEAGFQVFNACAAWDSNDWSTASCLCEIDDETLYDEFFECDECENDTNQDTIQGLRDYQCELANSLYSTYVPYSTPPFSGYLTRTYSFENQIFYYTYNGTNIFTTNSDGQTILQTLTQTNGSSSTNTVSYQVTDLNNNTETYASSFSLTSLPSYASTQGTVVDSGQPIQIASSTLSPSSSSSSTTSSSSSSSSTSTSTPSTTSTTNTGYETTTTTSLIITITSYQTVTENMAINKQSPIYHILLILLSIFNLV